MTRLIRQHIFLLFGLGALLYFFFVDLESMRPGPFQYAIFALGFVSMLIYVVQSFLRLREKWRAEQKN
jgi:hypothetical protein